MRLIDADALKEKIDHIMLILNIGRGYGKRLLQKAIRYYANLISKDIETAPTVDAVSKELYDQVKYERDALQEMVDNSEQRWIPVSERLPDDLEEVNVTWVNHAPEQYYDFVKDKLFSGSAVYYKRSWYWYSSTCVDILAEYGRNEMDKIDDGIEVIAWMPLPKPYREETEDVGKSDMDDNR